jgi:hypothetical protein
MKTSLLYTSNLTETQKAYIAGFFDGEGCLNYYKSKTKTSKLGYTFVGQAFITNTDFDTMIALRTMIGFGCLRKRKTYSYDGNRKETWNLCFSPRQVKLLMREIYPYLITKKQRAKIMLDFLDTLIWGRGQGKSLTQDEIKYREELFIIFRRLNHRGIQNKTDEIGENNTTTPSQAIEGRGSMEGVETTKVSPNNNLSHELPSGNRRYSPSLLETIGSQDKEPDDNKTVKIQRFIQV